MLNGAPAAGAVDAPMINIGSYGTAWAQRDRFDHPRKMFDLTGELIRRRHSSADTLLIIGGSFRRLLGAVWA